jgi:septum formation protein
VSGPVQGGSGFILASASPRRLDLLRQIGIEPDTVISPAIDETPQPGESPRLLAARLARAKLDAIPPANAFVLAADTVVGAGTRVLPKAETEAEARFCLGLLSGRRHRVYSAVAVRAPDGRTGFRNVLSIVGFARLDHTESVSYIESGEWRGKAGGYAIQGRAARFIDFISGSYSGVVGLPLHETAKLLRGLGYSWRG